MQNRVFFPQSALDVWLSDGTVDLRGDELTIVAEGRRYRLVEAVRIVSEVTGAPDVHDLVGRVKPKALLLDKNGDVSHSSLLLGDNAYDVVPGWLGEPIGTFVDHVTSQKKDPSIRPGPAPASDEDLLMNYLSKNL
jgi:hypothetical protein